MFAIYTPNGRSFLGTLEGLRTIEKSNKTIALRKHQEVDDPQSPTTKKYTVSTNAIDAYKKVIKKQNEIYPIFHAYQVMSSPVEVLRGDDLFKVAIEKFSKLPIQEFPIINHKNELIGTLSRLQIYEFILKNKSTENATNNNKTLAELFLTDESKAYSAEPVTDIRRIAALFIENELHTIPIIENTGKIVGIISRADIIKAAIKDPALSLWC